MNRGLAEQIMEMAEADQVARYQLLKLENDPHTTLEDREKAVAQGNADAKDYAYLLDRVKVNQGKPQVYGTQIELNDEGTSFQPQVMIVPAKVNQRRAEVGLEPVEAYIDNCNQLYCGSLKSDPS